LVFLTGSLEQTKYAKVIKEAGIKAE